MTPRSSLHRALLLTVLALTLVALPSRAATAVDSILVNPLSFRIEPANPCPGDTLYLIADLCAPCGQFISGGTRVEGVMRFEVATRVGVPCPASPCPMDSRAVRLGVYPSGTFGLGITTIVHTRYPDSSLVSNRLYSDVSWTVADSCGPPPPPGEVPYGLKLRIDAPAECDTCAPRLCAGEPLRVKVSGTFPDGCYEIASLRTLPLGSPVDLPVVFMDVIQRSGFCTQSPVPFDTSITLSAQPIGPHVLRFELTEARHDFDPNVVDPIVRSWVLHRNFNVSDSCGPPSACVWPWLAGPGLGDPDCSTTIQPGGVATLPLSVNTPVALAGLEGSIRPEAPLRIESLTLGAGAEGMRLEWERTAEGVRYVLFSGAAHIAAHSSAPILRVGLSLAANANAPLRMGVLGTVTGASDSLGDKVPVCVVNTLVPVRGAIVCLDGGCDVNGDGIANVRDLVRMARCLRPGAFCPDSAALPDCDGNGTFGVGDVICCARHVLHGGRPDTSGTRSAPGLTARFGEPRIRMGASAAAGVDLPFSLTGTRELGSARVLLRYPADRFTWDAAQFHGDPDGWLALAEEISPGVIALGAIQLGGDVDELPWTLALKLRPGSSAGGSVAVESGEFSATDGVTLAAPMAGATSVELDGRTPVESRSLRLGAARPNPSAGDARFAVELPVDSDVDLSVHDISGRTIATLYRGRLTAGARDFVWHGADDSGRRTPDGVYFVRLKVDGQVKSQRVTVLRGR